MGTELLLATEPSPPRRHARPRYFTLQRFVIGVIATAFTVYFFNHIRPYVGHGRYLPVIDAPLGPEDIWDSVSHLLLSLSMNST